MNCLNCDDKWQADSKTGCWNDCREYAIELIKKNICPDCRAKIVQEGGCAVCYECGWAKCS